MTESTTSEPARSNWDLTSRISPYLDRHMLFPLLNYLEQDIYDPKDVAAARLQLLEPTNMVDYAIELTQDKAKLEELEQKKSKVVQELKELESQCKVLDDLCKNETERNRMAASQQWTVSGVCAIDGITKTTIDTYRVLAKFNYECGDYEAASERISNYISLLAHPPLASIKDEDELETTTAPKVEQSKEDIGNPSLYYLKTVTPDLLAILWGKLAADVMRQEWQSAIVAVDAVKVAIESLVSSNHMTAIQALQERSWLMHWSLFCFWNARTGLEQMVDLFHSDRYKQAITTQAPHLLRYLTAAVLLCKRRKSKSAKDRRWMKNLIHVMQDCAEYTDPIVEFVHCLCVKFDFDGAQKTLIECQSVLQTDFFLCKQTALFMEEARVFVFENYCRIHNKIDLKTLGDKLAMDPEEAERWIVDLIRNADLDAKIDSAERCVVMGSSTQSIYEQVMEKTRDLNVRSATLAQNLQSMLNEARKEKAKRAKALREMDE